MGGNWTIEDLFAAGRILNGAAPYAILASPSPGQSFPKVNASYLNLLV
jgi:hypothetical protein